MIRLVALPVPNRATVFLLLVVLLEEFTLQVMENSFVCYLKTKFLRKQVINYEVEILSRNKLGRWQVKVATLPKTGYFTVSKASEDFVFACFIWRITLLNALIYTNHLQEPQSACHNFFLALWILLKESFHSFSASCDSQLRHLRWNRHWKWDNDLCQIRLGEPLVLFIFFLIKQKSSGERRKTQAHCSERLTPEHHVCNNVGQRHLNFT